VAEPTPTPAAAPARRRLDLSDPGTARAVARRAGLALTPRLGQHLLVDRAMLGSLVEALDPGPDDEVLEIGPGIGTLTVELADRARRVVAVELDEAAVRACAIWAWPLAIWSPGTSRTPSPGR